MVCTRLRLWIALILSVLILQIPLTSASAAPPRSANQPHPVDAAHRVVITNESLRTTTYWSTAPTEQTTVMVAGEQQILPGPDATVDLIVVLTRPALQRYRQSLPASLSAAGVEQTNAINQHLAQIEAEQRGLLSELQRANLLRGVNHRYQRLINAIAIAAPMGQVDAIAALPGVQGVYADYRAQITLADSAPLIGAPAVWTQTDGGGQAITGAGVRIAIIDTGIDYTHADLGGCFGAGCRVVGGYDFVNADADPKDDNRHGTHVAAIAAGSGAAPGVAPGATLLAYKVCDQYGSCQHSHILAALERATDPDQNPLTADAVDVINMSLGGPGSADDPLAVATNAAVAAGVVVAAAAGNDYHYRAIGSPGSAADAITVGATTKSDGMAVFSSKGWVGDFAIKPDVSAPGEAIRAATPNDSYQVLSGTSMATPHVAGASALLRQANPTWTPAQIKLALMNTAKDIGVDPFAQGAGRIQVDQALNPHVVLQPAALSFGLVDPSQTTWQKTLPVTITNATAALQNYTLAIADGLPTGLSATVVPTQLALNPGQAAIVQVTVTVDNNLLPFPQHQAFTYAGAVTVVNGGETRRVLFALVKAAVLELFASGAENFIYLFRIGDPASSQIVAPPIGAGRATGARALAAAAPATMRYLIPLLPGSYDLIAGYYYDPTLGYYTKSFVIHEGINVNPTATAAVALSDAVHEVAQTFRKLDGSQETIDSHAMIVLGRKTSGASVSIMSSGLPGEALSFSSISDQYYIETCDYQRLYPTANEQVVNDLCYGLDGVSASQSQHLDAQNLKKLTYVIDADPQVVRAQPVMMYQISPWAAAGPLLFESDWMALRPFRRTFYHTPMSHPSAMARAFFPQRQNAAGDYLEMNYYSPLLQFLNSQMTKVTYRNMAQGSWVTEVLTTTSENWLVPHGPVYWGGHFSNSEASVQLGANALWGTWNGYFPYLRDQQQSILLAAPISYTLTNNGSVTTGSLSQINQLNVTPGPVTLQIGYHAYVNGGLSQGEVTANFNTSANDRNPPQIQELNVIDNTGLRSANLTGAGTIAVRVADDAAVVTLGLAVNYGDGQGWRTLTPTLVNGFHRAPLPVYSGENPAAAALRIDAADSAGNTLRNEISPAFRLTAAPTPAKLLYLSPSVNGALTGLTFADEDILGYDAGAKRWSLLFDGSDVGLAKVDVDAFHLWHNSSILLAFDKRVNIPGLGWVETADVVKFTPTQLGAVTAGGYQLFFDGSDVGLSSSAENIDALAVDASGRLLLSTTGNASVPGATAADEDLLAFSATSTGATTSGSWSLFWDGSDVGLTTANEDVNGAWLDSVTNKLHLITLGAYSVMGVSGDSDDVLVCTPGSFGPNTACTFSRSFDGDLASFNFALDDLAVAPAPTGVQIQSAEAESLASEGAPFAVADDPIAPADETEDQPQEPQLYLPMIDG